MRFIPRYTKSHVTQWDHKTWERADMLIFKKADSLWFVLWKWHNMNMGAKLREWERWGWFVRQGAQWKPTFSPHTWGFVQPQRRNSSWTWELQSSPQMRTLIYCNNDQILIQISGKNDISSHCTSLSPCLCYTIPPQTTNDWNKTNNIAMAAQCLIMMHFNAPRVRPADGCHL